MQSGPGVLSANSPYRGLTGSSQGSVFQLRSTFLTGSLPTSLSQSISHMSTLKRNMFTKFIIIKRSTQLNRDKWMRNDGQPSVLGVQEGGVENGDPSMCSRDGGEKDDCFSPAVAT